MSYTVINKDTEEEIDCDTIIEARWHLVRLVDSGYSAYIHVEKYQFTVRCSLSEDNRQQRSNTLEE